MTELKFERNENTLLVNVNTEGVYFICGWTVVVPQKTALEYAKKFTAGNLLEVDGGFFLDQRREH